jgi:hypothetical protein
MLVVLKCLLTTSPFILLLISSSMVKLASNEFADFLPRVGMTLDYHLVDFLHLVTTPAENQRPTATNVSNSPPPLPFLALLAISCTVYSHGMSC